MRATSEARPQFLAESLIATYAINDAMNQLILANLDARVWRARELGQNGRGARTIGAIFAHLHNSRLRWLRYNAPHLKRPAPLDPHRCTMKQAAAALEKSAELCLQMLREALSDDPKRRVTEFRRDSWMPTWPASGTMFAYMFGHEAHHRGQILMLAHQLGCRIPNQISYPLWYWEKLWKPRGLKHPK